jgi:hypothetical protein
MKQNQVVYLTIPLILAAASGLTATRLLPTLATVSPREGSTFLTPSEVSGLDLRPQPATERRWIPWNAGPDRSFRVARAASPSRMIASADALFVLSNSQQSVYKYSAAGDLLHQYKEADESRFVADLAVTREGLLWTADPNGITQALASDGTVAQRLPKELHAQNLTALDSTLVVVPVATRAFKYGDAMLVLVRGTDAPVVIPSFVQDHARFGMAVIGIPVVSPDHSEFFYVTKAAGIIGAYSATGTLRYAVRTIGGQGLPELELTRSGAIKLSATGREKIRGACVVGPNLLTLSDVRSNDPAQRDPSSVIDAYTRETGRYIGSWTLPQRAHAIEAWQDRLYVATNNDVHLWALPDAVLR